MNDGEDYQKGKYLMEKERERWWRGKDVKEDVEEDVNDDGEKVDKEMGWEDESVYGGKGFLLCYEGKR